MSKKALLAVAVGLLLMRSSHAGAFSDVPFDHWAYNAVQDLAQAGILEGYPGGTFDGPQPMTRYEFAVAIHRMLKNLEKLPKGMSKEDLEKWFAENRAKLVGPAGSKGDKGDSGSAGAKGGDGTKGADGRDGAPGAKGEKGDKGADGQIPKDWLTKLEAIEKLTKEFKGELDTMGQNVNQALARIAALESKAAAMADTLNDHEARIEELERIKWYGGITTEIGLDGAIDQTGAQDGDLGFESGEAFSYLGVKVGLDANLGGDMRGRVTWWYDSDANQHHGLQSAGLAGLGVDEAWVRLPGLGGKWIFGRQYAGQDYESGAATPALGLGTGYYTGAALTGIRAEYGLGTFGKLTLLAQADDSAASGVGGGILNANVAGVARWDVDFPWFKKAGGEPLIKLGFQTVGHMPNNNAAGIGKGFNDGTRSSEWSISANAYVNVLKGLKLEYTSQFRNEIGTTPDLNLDTDADGQVIYAELGILDTPTFELAVKGGLVEQDYTLSHSILTNPYTRANGVFTLMDRPVMLDSFINQFGPTQGFDVDFKWNIGSRPLKVRWAGSTRRLDLFNWAIGGSFPLVQTGKGDVSIQAIYADVDPGHALNVAGLTSQGVMGVRLVGGFSF